MDQISISDHINQNEMYEVTTLVPQTSTIKFQYVQNNVKALQTYNLNRDVFPSINRDYNLKIQQIRFKYLILQ